MGVTVTNCKRCNKVFQQVRQPFCPACTKIEDDKFSRLYRALQNSALQGGIAIDTLAKSQSVPLEEVERHFLAGSFGTAGVYLHIYCQACGALCHANQRLGRYCVSCSETTANKAGVEVQNLKDLMKRQAHREQLESQARLLRENQERRASHHQFGHILRHS